MHNYILNADCIITPEEKLENTSILVSKGRIKDIGDPKKNGIFEINIKNKVVLPALINAHDHLFGNYYPKIGNGPYLNWKAWDDDLKSDPVYKERSKIKAEEIYLLGSYRNIISGVTTVSDHIPHFVNNSYIPKMPLRIIKEYSLAHESSSYDLKWGDGIEVEHRKAKSKKMPFITHIEEGYDEEAQKGVDLLNKLGALDEFTVMIHGIALSESDIRLIANKKAHLVWCPNSNVYMFNRTADVKSWIKFGINVSLGTDSPASGGLNILDEMQFAKKVYKTMYNSELDDKAIVNMVTINAAKAMRISDKLGTISKNNIADIIAVNMKGKNPYKSVVNAKLEDISLVIYKGEPVYGDIEYSQFFRKFNIKFKKFEINGVKKVMNGDPVALMKQISKIVGYKKEIPFLPVI